MKKSEGSTEQEVVIAKWLRERYQEYQDMLLHSLSSSTTSYNEKRVSLKLLMQLVKEEIMAPESKNGSTWRRGLFLKLLCALVKSRSDSQIITDFITQYLEHYEDARFYTFLALRYVD
jgi:U3 small nucleolar RNA-associated protein 19